jgi:hypothetical protein
MLIAIDHSNAGRPCTVHLGDYHVRFGSDAQAEAFISQLRKRIAAPHVLPRAAPGEFRCTEATFNPLNRSA